MGIDYECRNYFWADAGRIGENLLIFSNIGFMGIPVIKSIYGDQAMIYVAFYILAYNLLLYTYGYCLSEKPVTADNTGVLVKQPFFYDSYNLYVFVTAAAKRRR